MCLKIFFTYFLLFQEINGVALQVAPSSMEERQKIANLAKEWVRKRRNHRMQVTSQATYFHLFQWLRILIHGLQALNAPITIFSHDASAKGSIKYVYGVAFFIPVDFFFLKIHILGEGMQFVPKTSCLVRSSTT